MSYSATDRKKDLKLYDRMIYIGLTIHKVGYPSYSALYSWIRQREEINTDGKHVITSVRLKIVKDFKFFSL